MHNRVLKQTPLRHRLSGFNGDEIDSTSNRNWRACTKCGLCRTRTRVALKRRGGSGRIRLLLIVEAPDDFDDTLGVPQVGLTGNILKHIIDFADIPFSYLITPIVCCKPATIIYLTQEGEDGEFDELEPGLDYDVQDHYRDPSPEEIAACSPHIHELVDDYEPHAIVYVGVPSKTYSKNLPSITLRSLNSILNLEYKLQSVRKETQKLNHLLHSLAETI